MKRSVLAILMALAVAGAYSQDMAAIQKGFTDFAGQLAPTLSYNATVGNAWSDAYIGNFPHFGVGVAAGATTVPADSLKPLFDSMNIALPAELTQYGLPIPAAAIGAKLGGFFLPFDIGVKGMILPDSLKAKLAASGMVADYTLIGGNIRYALLKENIILPDLSVGVGYNRLVGAIVTPLGVTGQSFSFNTSDNVPHTLALTDPDLALRWTTDSYDFTLQVSKNLLFVRPYLGLGYSLGTSSVRGGLESQVTYDGNPVTAAELAAIKAALASAGVTVTDLSTNGILFGAESKAPVLRLYGGASLALFFFNLDAALSYVPATKSLGASAMVRVQF